MLNLRGAFLSRRGFTLIELIIGLAILSILLSSIYSLLFFTLKLTDSSDQMDEALYNGRYAMEYIKDEIARADKIYSSSRFKDLDAKFPTNPGFVLLKEEVSYDKDGVIIKIDYNFKTYYQKNDELMRIAYNTSNAKNLDGKQFAGYNLLCDGMLDFSKSFFDIENEFINLCIIMKQGVGELVLETSIGIRCPAE